MYRSDISKISMPAMARHVVDLRVITVTSTAGGARSRLVSHPARVAFVSMSFRPESMRGAPSAGHVGGQIDYRLARNAVVSEFRKGRLSRLDVCDAHPELLRAAINVGQETREDCPICEETKVVLVSYVFGSRLPPSGKCVTSQRELTQAGPRRPRPGLLRRRGLPELLVEPPGPHVHRRQPESRLPLKS